jgi:RimJ/RimL family protein N-acetyltransferase
MPLGELVVREAEPADAPAVCEYLAELIAEDLPVLVLFDRAPTVEVEERFLRRCRDSPNSTFLVALRAGRVIGQLELAGGWPAKRAHSGSVATSVHRSCRGQGVGTALLEHLFRWVDRHPTVSRVELEVLSNNPAALRLYERLGFHTEGRRQAAAIVDGRPVDAILMARLWPGKGVV